MRLASRLRMCGKNQERDRAYERSETENVRKHPRNSGEKASTTKIDLQLAQPENSLAYNKAG